MTPKTALLILFSSIFIVMVLGTGYASTQQAVQNWTGLTVGPDRYWTIATLLDAYCGFITFYVWVVFKEARWLARVLWFIAIMLLGNMAMSAYVLYQIARLPKGRPVADILVARNS